MARFVSALESLDAELIEMQYRAGIFSNRELARMYGVSINSIQRWARKFGWTRDLEPSVRKKIKDKLVARTPAGEKLDMMVVDAEKEEGEAREATMVEMVADFGAAVVLGQQQGTMRLAEIQERLETILKERLAAAEELGAKKVDLDQLKDLVSILKDLANTLKNRVEIERRVFNLDEPGIPIERLLSLFPEDARAWIAEELRKAL